MCGRKLLMNVAAAQGAGSNLSFKQYVEWLSSKGYVPPGNSDWLDHIRNLGNDANHEIPAIAKEDAAEMLGFLGMLLKFVFEYPAKSKARVVKARGK